ncbi:MAG: lysophospholipid acyltransferase family protein [Jannaschia sp.]
MSRRTPDFAINLLIRTALLVVRPFPLSWRVRAVRALTGWIVMIVPALARRVDDNLALVYPDMTPGDRRALTRRTARTAGATLTEILFNTEYGARARAFAIAGPGLEVLQAAQAEGRGALLISGHFGQWEAIRHALGGRGIDVGAVYRPNNNIFYDPLFRRALEAGGTPIIPKSGAGNRALLRHVREGGVLAMLADQYQQTGAALEFMGQAACTTLSPADLALRYDLPLIPAFGTRRDDAWTVDIILEAPIPPGSPERMMQDFNTRLAARVQQDPSQWYWFHQRWRPHKNAEVWPPEGWTGLASTGSGSA